MSCFMNGVSIVSLLWLQVEICVLTGEKSILRSDIIYDCGQSLNPAVDMGQVVYVLRKWCLLTYMDNAIN